MIRVSEAVLPGHPDKLCDHVAESLVQAALAVDPEAYAQFEAGIWCDQLWLSGGYAARGPAIDVERIATDALDAIARAVEPDAPLKRWHVTNAVCRYDVDPLRWSRHVNDQAIVIGWAGYDAKVRWLPPEHFLVLEFRDALWDACRGGELARCGPDGKLIVRLKEDAEGFALEHVLVTLEHPEALPVLALAEQVNTVLSERYARLRRSDARWLARWADVELLVNPNGPLSDAGSQKDNGQTGRKLVMDYFGPRVPLGGGAIYGKHPTHVDRFGARVARELAIDAVKRGAGECLVRAVYAPNLAEPLDVQMEVTGGEGRIREETQSRSPRQLLREPLEPVAECGGHVEYGLEARVPVAARCFVQALAAEACTASQLCHASGTRDGAERRDDGRRIALRENLVQVSDDRPLVVEILR